MFKGSIVGSFGFWRKTTTRELTVFQMIAQAFAANPLFIAGIIRTSTLLEIFLFAAFHKFLPPFSVCRLQILQICASSNFYRREKVFAMKKAFPGKERLL